jgi:hypothetical protein
MNKSVVNLSGTPVCRAHKAPKRISLRRKIAVLRDSGFTVAYDRANKAYLIDYGYTTGLPRYTRKFRLEQLELVDVLLDLAAECYWAGYKRSKGTDGDTNGITKEI